MKFLLMLIVLGVLSACGLDEEESQHKFAIRKKAQSVVMYHYAKYLFSHAEYEDVEVAVKVAVRGGQAMTLWVKDLSAPTPLEEAELTSSGNGFRGTSMGVSGGTYTGELEMTRDAVTGCCGEMAFVPISVDSVSFVGTKIAVLTAETWEQLTSPPTIAEPPAVQMIALGTVQVGELFSITGADVARLEAHNSDGKIEGALAQWQTDVGRDVFAVTGTAELFLTAAAVRAQVTELAGFDADGNKVLQAELTAVARDDDITLQAARFSRGGYTWVAFSDNPNPDPDNEMFMLDVNSNSYLSLNAEMEVHDHHLGAISYQGRDGRGYWVGMYRFECLVNDAVMARVVDTIYTGHCLAEGG